MVDKILAYMRANVPLLLWGPPGVGKTATVNALGKRLGIHVETVIASLHEPVDFAGWPIVHQGDVLMAPPPWLKRLKEHPRGILFLDEITNAPPSVQAALLRVILERVVGDERLPDSVYVLAAANPPELATDGYALRPALANRLAHVEFKLDPKEWAEQFPMYWGDPPSVPNIDETEWLKVRALIATFIMRRPELLLQVPKDEDSAGKSWPSPRSWDAASRLLAIHAPVPAHELAEYVASAVGEAAALEFCAWAKELDLPDPEELIASPDKMRVPAEADRQFAVLAAVAASVASNLTVDRWRAFGKIIAKFIDSGAEDVAMLQAKHYSQMLTELRKTDRSLEVDRDVMDRIKPVLHRLGILAKITE